MPKLHEILALERGASNRAEKALTQAHHQLQNSGLLSGLVRTYKPYMDGDFKYPDERTEVKLKSESTISDVTAAVSSWYDIVASRELTNAVAAADVMVDEKVVLKGVPVTFLLFLEKQLIDLLTFARKLTVLDPSEIWQDGGDGVFKSDPTETAKTKKQMKNHVKFEGNEHHPPQIETFTEDIPIGTWKTIKFSGAVTAERKEEMIRRIEKLQDGVRVARERANSIEAVSSQFGTKLIRLLFEK